jgi:hypothetical protein
MHLTISHSRSIIINFRPRSVIPFCGASDGAKAVSTRAMPHGGRECEVKHNAVGIGPLPEPKNTQPRLRTFSSCFCRKFACFSFAAYTPHEHRDETDENVLT